MAATTTATNPLHTLLSLPHHPLNDDSHPTPTSIEEQLVESDIHDVLRPYTTVSPDASPVPLLRRRAHLAFIGKLLAKPLPAAYVGFDSTRPWLLYWSLHTYTLLNHPVDDVLRMRAVSTLLSCQDTTRGGFGGSPGHIGHLMATYAAINALCIVGSPGPAPSREECEQVSAGKTTLAKLGKGGWDGVDRKKLYEWMMRLKQPDGSFTVHEGGEVDVRASYCVWCVATLTGIATRELIEGMPEFLASCQSYEGGLSSTSFPTYTRDLKLDTSRHRPALGEAHGGYAFCAAAAYLGLSLLDDNHYPSTSSSSIPAQPQPRSHGNRLDIRKLTRWTLDLQCPFPSQGGGFKGRINKLVDGCYSWFSGAGMWGVVESLQQVENEKKEARTTTRANGSTNGNGNGSSKASVPVTAAAVPELWDRAALQSYILCVAQAVPEDCATPSEAAASTAEGGLRDKPGKKADAYHTCYNLSGLSASQHVVRPCRETREFCYKGWKSAGSAGGGGEEEEEELRRRIFSSMLGFNLAPGREKLVVGSHSSAGAVVAGAGTSNEVLPTHPVLNVGFVQARGMMLWAYGQEGP